MHERPNSISDFWNGRMYHERYIEKVLSLAKKYGDNVFGNDWTFRIPIANRMSGANRISHVLLTKIDGRQIAQI